MVGCPAPTNSRPCCWTRLGAQPAFLCPAKVEDREGAWSLVRQDWAPVQQYAITVFEADLIPLQQDVCLFLRARNYLTGDVITLQLARGKMRIVEVSFSARTKTSPGTEAVAIFGGDFHAPRGLPDDLTVQLLKVTLP